MVTYTEWTEIGHEVYKSKGGSYGSRQAAQSITSTLASFWQNNTEQLRSASRSQAKQIAQQNMDV